MPPGPDWPALVQHIWADGAAIFPIDHRLPEPDVQALLLAAKPTLVIGPEGEHRPPDGRSADPDVAVIVATSGTAGRPKLVQFDRNAIDAAVASSALALDAGPADRWLCCLPVAHIGGLLVLMRAVLLGAPVSVHVQFDVEPFAMEPRMAFTSIVPTMLGRLVDAGVDLSHFRAVLVGGGPVPEELVAKAREGGANVVSTYGLTESCGGVVHDGRPLPGTRVRLGPDDEIQLNGPTLMLGYRDDPEATTRAFTEDRWLRTDDAGVFDGEGRLAAVGRLDDVVLSGGEKIWPDEVEAALRHHLKVADVAVRGRPDSEWGTRVVAFVVPSDPDDPPSLESLRDVAAQRLPRYKAPQELVLVDELPRTPLGKVRRVALG